MKKRPMLLQSRLIRHSFRTYPSGFNWENSTLTAGEAEALERQRTSLDGEHKSGHSKDIG